MLSPIVYAIPRTEFSAFLGIILYNPHDNLAGLVFIAPVHSSRTWGLEASGKPNVIPLYSVLLNESNTFSIFYCNI